MNLHLLTFGAPIKNYNWTLDRLKNESEYIKVFKSINIFHDENIFDFCPELKLHEKFMKLSRGYGYWIWKYFLISKLFENIPENDIILYLDAGCSINEKAVERLKFYYQIANKFNILAFKLNYLEKKYTKKDTYSRIIGNDETFYDNEQVHASAFFIKKTKNMIEFIEEIKKVSIENDYHYVNDNESVLKNDKTFIEHRHDQSLFSLMCKKNNAHLIEDETYWEPNWNVDGRNYPIWVMRIK